MYTRKIRESIPDWLDALGEQELGEKKWSVELSALNEEAPVVLRVNTLKITRRDLQARLSDEHIETLVSEDYPDALVLSERQNIFRSSAFKEVLLQACLSAFTRRRLVARGD